MKSGSTRVYGHLLLAFLLLVTTVSRGQSSAGSIFGNIEDINRAAVAGAVVTVTDDTTRLTLQTTSSADGSFVIPQLPPGRYTISVEKTGFKKVEKADVILTTAGKLNAGRFVLEVGAVGETVTVMADAGQLQLKSESGERSDLLTGTQIKDLALNGRNMLDLLKTVPGVVSNVRGLVSGPGGLGDFSMNGTRGNQHEMVIDGSSNVETGSNAAQHVTINPDAVAEVKILTANYQAEFGKSGGGFLSFTTRSGTSEFHGAGRYFHRHEGLNANNFFRNAEGVDPATGLQRQPRPIYRYNYSGYDIGGPVYLPFLGFNRNRDKLFFFWNQEYYEQLVPNAAQNIRVPTAEERMGDFSGTRDGRGNRVYIKDPTKSGTCDASNTVANPGACFVYNGRLHVIDPARFDRSGQAILNLYPLPNFTGEDRFNYSSSIPNAYPRREDILRLDYNITGVTRLTARVINNAGEQSLPYGSFAGSFNFPLTRIASDQAGFNGALTLTHTFNPTLTNEFIFGPSRSRLSSDAEDSRATRTSRKLYLPAIYGARQSYLIPNLSYGGPLDQTFPATDLSGVPLHSASATFNIIDNLTKAAGSHVIKAGIFIQRSRRDQTEGGPANGQISFSSDPDPGFTLNTGHPYANALLGIYNSFEQSSSRPTGHYRYTNVEFYVQDTWRARSRLTLDYGIRFSWFQPQYDELLRASVFNPDLFDKTKAVRLYRPIRVGAVRGAVDPANPGVVLPPGFIGQIVPGSGDLENGMGRASEGYPRGGFEDRGLLLGPRFGFAYQLTDDARTVLRGGFGISYDRIQGAAISDQLSNPPAVTTSRLRFGTLRDVPGIVASGGSLTPPDVIGYARDGKIPTVYSFSLGIQRAVGASTIIDLAYVGTLSRHLLQQRDLNAVPYGTTFTRQAQDPSLYAGGVVPTEEPDLPGVYRQAGLSFTGQNALPTDLLRPYPGYGSILFREFVGSSNYHAMQLSINRRFSRGLTFGIAYTFSKAMATASRDFEGTNPFNSRLYDYRLASFDRTHVFIANYVYDLPKMSRIFGDFGASRRLGRALLDDWQISGISQLSSGSPLELGVGIRDVNAGRRVTGSDTSGPLFLLRGDPGKGPNGLLINPSAFVVPPIGGTGPWPRTYLRNPGDHVHDISIFKNFPLGGDGSRRLQLRFEMFNAFNQTRFSSINTSTQLAVRDPAQPGMLTTNSDLVFAYYDQAVITDNIRGLRSNDGAKPLGRFFGEYNRARDARIIQLGVKLYF
jgi:hypothetical protein